MQDHNLFLDIETIGAVRQDVREFIANTIKPPATIKLPASLEKWHKESKPEAVEEAIAKTGLDGAFGQIVVIGYGFDDADEPGAIYGLQEDVVLDRFNEMLHEHFGPSMYSAVTVVGHNVANFDLRFLYQRYVVNGIRPHPIINVAVNAKPWDSTKVFDTMVQFAGVGNRISLDKLCMALTIASPKGEMDGSMVSQAVADGRLEEVAAYCKRDVVATRECYRRMTFAS